jgi:hypothetical protein
MNKNTAIIKAGVSTTNQQNKYKVGIIIARSQRDNLPGYIVQIDDMEQFYYIEQVTLLKDYIENLNETKKLLLTLDHAGINTTKAFKTLCDLVDDLS